MAWLSSFSVCRRMSTHLAFSSSRVTVLLVIASCRVSKKSSWYLRSNSFSNFSLLVLVLITVGGSGRCFFGMVRFDRIWCWWLSSVSAFLTTLACFWNSNACFFRYFSTDIFTVVGMRCTCMIIHCAWCSVTTQIVFVYYSLN